MKRYAHIFLALLLSSMLSITFAVNAFADEGILLAQAQKQKSQPVAPQKTTPVSPATPTTAPATDGQITNVTTRPASGLWHTGTPVDVQWQWPGYTNHPADVTLWSGTTQVAVIISRWVGQSVGWNVPYNLAPGPYKVRVQSSNNNRNFSEAMVRVELCTLAVTSPTRTDRFWAGSSTTQIAWTFTGGNPGPLKLELVSAGGGSAQLIADKVAWGNSGSGQYSWQIPGNTNPGNYQIRITSMGNSVMTATSQTFSVDKFGSVGIIVADPNNAPIDGATVSVIVNGVARSATTRGDGRALFDLLPPGTYTFTATKSGYYHAGTAVTLASGATQSGVIKLEKLGSIQISVVEPNKTPIVGATVTVIVNGVAHSATTDYAGFAIHHLPAGTYTFTATKSGYIPLGTPGTKVTIASGGFEDVQINLQKIWGSVSIVVSDPTIQNMPTIYQVVAGATVTVFVNGVERSATTNGDGQAFFDLLPPGTYVFAATKSGYIPVGNANTTVTLAGGATQSGVIHLQLGIGSIKVAVKDGANPVNNMYVMVASGPNAPSSSNKTSADGTVTFDKVPMGTWLVKALASEYNPYYPPPHYMESTGQYVVVQPGATATITLSLQRFGNATITVTDGTMPIYRAKVCADPPTCSSSIYTDALGKATIDISPGSHTIQVEANDYKTEVLSVTIPSGGTVTRTVTLSSQFGYATIIVTDGTVPIVFSKVCADPPNPGPNNSCSSSVNPTLNSTLGRTTFRLTPGSHTFQAEAPGFKTEVFSLTIPSGGAVTTVTRTVALTKN